MPLLFRTRMGDGTSWCCSFFASLGERFSKQDSSSSRSKQRSMRSQHPEIVLVEGSCVSTSTQVPEMYRQRINDSPEDQSQPESRLNARVSSKVSGDRSTRVPQSPTAADAESDTEIIDNELYAVDNRASKCTPAVVKLRDKNTIVDSDDEMEIIDNELYSGCDMK